MRYATIFSGIGGWELGLNACGWELAWQCEREPFCRALLKERFGVPIYPDATTLVSERPERVDAIAASWPCQPFSIAGRRGGEADHRNLWPPVIGIIRYFWPDWFLGENVVGASNMVLSGWQDDLESLGYQSIAFDIPACAVGLPTVERHIWLIAARDGQRLEGRAGPKSSQLHLEGAFQRNGWADGAAASWLGGGWNLPSPQLLRSRKGFPNFMDRISAIGNAVPPQIPHIIGQAINQIESQ